jgi:hypothetical protein
MNEIDLLRIPMEYTPAGYMMNPQTEDLFRVEDIREGMIILPESMHAFDDPKDLDDPDLNEKSRVYLKKRLDSYQKWVQVTNLQQDRSRGQASWIALYGDGAKVGQRYGYGHFFFVKLDSITKD